MTIYEEMIRDAVRWCDRAGVSMPVVWYRGQPEASYDRQGVRLALRALMRRCGCQPWQARIVEHDVGAFTVPALAISLEPVDMASVACMFGSQS